MAASLTAVFTILTVLMTTFGWPFPLVMTKDFVAYAQASDERFDSIETDIGEIKGSIKDIRVGQLEDRELTVKIRMQEIGAALAGQPPGPVRAQLQQQLYEAEQELIRVNNQLRSAGAR